MSVIQLLREKARQNVKHIVLPEGSEERTVEASALIVKEGIAKVTLLGNEEEIKGVAALRGVSLEGVNIVDPISSPKFDVYAEMFYQLRKSKGVTIEQARDTVKNTLYFAAMMLKAEDADGFVAGAINTTGNTLKPALQIIKTKPGIPIVSSCFLMELPDNRHGDYGDNNILFFADCAVNINPGAEDLAAIAVATADTAKSLVGMEAHEVVVQLVLQAGAELDVGQNQLVGADGRLLARLVLYDRAVVDDLAHRLLGERVVGGVGRNHEERQRAAADIEKPAARKPHGVIQRQPCLVRVEAVRKVETAPRRLLIVAEPEEIHPVLAQKVGAHGTRVDTRVEARRKGLHTEKLLRRDIYHSATHVSVAARVEHLAHADALYNIAAEELQRDVLIFGIFRRYRETVQQRGVITVAKPANEDILHTLLPRNPRNLRNGRLCIAHTLARHFQGSHIHGHSQGLLLFQKKNVLTLAVGARNHHHLLGPETRRGKRDILPRNTVGTDHNLAERILAAHAGDQQKIGARFQVADRVVAPLVGARTVFGLGDLDTCTINRRLGGGIGDPSGYGARLCLGSSACKNKQQQ